MKEKVTKRISEILGAMRNNPVEHPVLNGKIYWDSSMRKIGDIWVCLYMLERMCEKGLVKKDVDPRYRDGKYLTFVIA